MPRALGKNFDAMAAKARGGALLRNNDPAAEDAKGELRRLVLREIGPERAHVFDAFAGEGIMWRAAWRGAANYVGCDLKWYRDERMTFVADCARVMRAIDLRAFNVFDFDSYGSPWTQALILAARRPVALGERVGLVLTEGSGLRLKTNGIPVNLAEVAGIRSMHPAGGARSHGELIDRALNGLCRRMKVRMARRWEARGKSGASMRYIALILEGLEAAS